ncbi:yemanuclein isoform X4 [Hermetia illucens]|uniref:yemanuclein isoform X4 n=1 Tax=Hermetia illucens TaxID=343691 RepID=UPI0018CC5287|nr:yemanuclein isoform X4 [Hermetia illucens]
MSEMKRVAFTTLGTDLPSVRRSSNGNFSAAALFQDDEAAMLPPSTGGTTDAASTSATRVTSQGHGPKTFRLKLELFDPNVDTFPEFNYSKLVHVEKKKLKKLSKSNGFLDPFEENDDDVARIAKEFEKKYSGGYASKGRRSKKDDYYDKGAGYDESDSFIDNTEAYDEIIPEEVETVGGGFYINCGALEFTHLAEDDKIKATKPRKRALSSSSSSEDEDEGKKKQENGNEKEAVEEAIEGNTSPKEATTNGKVGNVDKRPKIAEDVIDQSAKLVRNQKDKKPEKARTKDVDSETYSDSGTEKEKEKDKERIVKTITVKDMLKANRDNFRKMQQEEDGSKGHQVNGGKVSDSEDSSGTTTDSEVETEPPDKKRRKSVDGDEGEKMRTSDVKLPDDLSEDVRKDIEELKCVVKASNQTGKPLHFTDQMIEIFLRIDDACSCLDKGVRNQIFAHLEFQLSLAKYYFLRKARTLRIKQEKNKTKRAYLKLKKTVAEVMPSILSSYEASCRKVEEMRTIASQNNVDLADLPKYPKKKFIWNDTIRNLLFELYQVRWTSYLVLRTRKEPLNDFITNYLKEKVIPIWPQGWMKYEELKKELEKRKKPKDNKKSEDEEASLSKRNVEIDKLPSILSNNSNVSIISTKDLVVTISTKSDKKTEVPLSSSDSLTVTPILSEPSSGSSNRPGIVNKTVDSAHQKSHKPSSVPNASLLISSASGPRSVSPLNLHQVSGNVKTGHASQTNHSSSKHSSDSKSSSTTNGAIRIRSVASVNSCLEKEKERRKESTTNSDHIRPSSRASSTTIEDLNVGSESDSDGVEIVGVFPVSNKKKKQSPPCSISAPPVTTSTVPVTIRTGSKHKDKKPSSHTSRSSSPSLANNAVAQNLKKEHSGNSGGKTSTVNSRYNDLDPVSKERRSGSSADLSATTAAATNNDKDNELDVFQIMQALKELETKLNKTNKSSEALTIYNQYNGLGWRLDEYFKSLSASKRIEAFTHYKLNEPFKK